MIPSTAMAVPSPPFKRLAELKATFVFPRGDPTLSMHTRAENDIFLSNSINARL